MFANIVQAIAGDNVHSSDEEDDRQGSPEPDVRQQKGADAKGAFDLWGLATAVADSVKKGTAGIATTVRETDWKAELHAFGKDVVEETEDLGHSAVAAVEHAVDAVEHLPQHAQTAMPAIEQRRRQVQQQLGQYGGHIGRFGRNFVANTTELFEQARDTIQQEMSAAAAEGRPRRTPGSSGSQPAVRYSRLDADIAAMQRDSGTYCDEPDDTQAYAAWLKDLSMEGRKEEIEGIVRDNTFMAELQSRIVPLIVEHATFWRRYFYRLHLLQEAHARRTRLAERAAAPQEEEVAWDDDDAASPAPSSTAASPAATAASDPATGDETVLAASETKVRKQASAAPEAAQPESPPSPTTSAAMQPKRDERGAAAEADAARNPSGSAEPGADSSASSAVRVSHHPSDEDAAATNSDSSGDYTVITSPSRRTAPSLPHTMLEAAAEPVAADAASDAAACPHSETEAQPTAQPASTATSAKATAAPTAPISGHVIADSAAASSTAATRGGSDEEDDDLGDIDVPESCAADSDYDSDWGMEDI